MTSPRPRRHRIRARLLRAGMTPSEFDLFWENLKKEPDFTNERFHKRSASQTLLNAFVWDTSPQGHKFWSQIKKRLNA